MPYKKTAGLFVRFRDKYNNTDQVSGISRVGLGCSRKCKAELKEDYENMSKPCF